MPRSLPQSFLAAARSAAESEPFAWLLEIEVPTIPPTRFRLTDQRTQVEHGYNTVTELPNIYYQAGFSIGEIEEAADSSRISLRVTVGNAKLETRQQLEDYDGLTDQPLKLKYVNLSQLEVEGAAMVIRGTVQRVAVTTEGVALDISLNPLESRRFPGRRYVRNHCRHAFGRGGCPYPIDHSGASYSACPKDVEACDDRGVDMVALGLAKFLPLRFGGFPGIGRGSR